MAKNVKKVNPKEVFKNEVVSQLQAFLVEKGYTVNAGELYGFSKGTLVIVGKETDLQLKPIVPKAGINHYEMEVEEE